MFCSTIIPTVGRATLSRAVLSVLHQSFESDDFEIIVVNDSGRRLDRSEWQGSRRVHVLNVSRRERSVARNAGASHARGRFLHFLDDDDWMTPTALQSFWELHLLHNPAWIYGTSRLVDGSERPLARLCPSLEGNCFVQVMAGEWIPLQASLIARSVFFSVGGFNPLLVGPEDIDLLRRIALKHNVLGTGSCVAYLQRDALTTTTDYGRHIPQSRWAREAILDDQAAFRRLRDSAVDPYWRGRLVRIFTSSAAWNLRRFRLATAGSRLAKGFLGCILAGFGVFSVDFWRALSTSYRSGSYLRDSGSIHLSAIIQGNS